MRDSDGGRGGATKARTISYDIHLSYLPGLHADVTSLTTYDWFRRGLRVRRPATTRTRVPSAIAAAATRHSAGAAERCTRAAALSVTPTDALAG